MKRATSLTPNNGDFYDFWSKLAEIGDAAMHHDAIKWSVLTHREFKDDHPYHKDFKNAAQDRGLEQILVLDVTDISRRDLTLPEGYEDKDFTDSTVNNAYIEEVVWLAGEASPDYFGLAVEINIYYNVNEAAFISWFTAYKEAYARLKAAYPNMEIFVYYQLEDLWGYEPGMNEPSRSPQWQLLRMLDGTSDLAVFSTYPGLVFEDPDSIPENYFSEPAQQVGMPIAYAELGYPSDSSDFNVSDPEEQKRFLERFLEMNLPLEPRFMVWYFMYDQNLTGSFPAGMEAYAEFFSSHGLRWTNGTAKPVWEVWRDFEAPR